jgi:hypothetical protein
MKLHGFQTFQLDDNDPSWQPPALTNKNHGLNKRKDHDAPLNPSKSKRAKIDPETKTETRSSSSSSSLTSTMATPNPRKIIATATNMDLSSSSPSIALTESPMDEIKRVFKCQLHKWNELAPSIALLATKLTDQLCSALTTLMEPPQSRKNNSLTAGTSAAWCLPANIEMEFRLGQIMPAVLDHSTRIDPGTSHAVHLDKNKTKDRIQFRSEVHPASFQILLLHLNHCFGLPRMTSATILKCTNQIRRVTTIPYATGTNIHPLASVKSPSTTIATTTKDVMNNSNDNIVWQHKKESTAEYINTAAIGALDIKLALSRETKLDASILSIPRISLTSLPSASSSTSMIAPFTPMQSVKLRRTKTIQTWCFRNWRLEMSQVTSEMKQTDFDLYQEVLHGPHARIDASFSHQHSNERMQPTTRTCEIELEFFSGSATSSTASGEAAPAAAAIPSATKTSIAGGQEKTWQQWFDVFAEGLWIAVFTSVMTGKPLQQQQAFVLEPQSFPAQPPQAQQQQLSSTSNALTINQSVPKPPMRLLCGCLTTI